MSLGWISALERQGRFGQAIRQLAAQCVPRSVFGARSFLKTAPSFITKTTFSIALISCVGSPSMAIMSASLPGSMVPMRSDQFNNSAPLIVAACKACSGVIPPRTRASTSFGKTNRILAVTRSQFRTVLKSVKRGHEPGALLRHQSGAFVIEHGAVFDRVHASANGGFDALGSLGVHHHAFARPMGDLDCFGHLFFAQLLHLEVAR